MEVAIGLIAVAVFIAVILKAQSILGMPFDAARVRAKRHVFRKGEYAEGKKLITYQIVFYSEWDVDDLRKGILSKIQPGSALPAIGTGFAIDSESDDLLVIACGNRLQTYFRGVLTLTRSGVGVEGSWTLISWLRHDGIVAAREPMKQIVRHIHSGVMSVDPGATFGLLPMERTPRVVYSSDLSDSVHIDYVRDYEMGMTAVSNLTLREGLVGESRSD